MTDEKRYIPRQALTKKQISKMSDEDLLARLSEREKKNIYQMTKLGFGDQGQERLPGESTGVWRQRLRENEKVDQEEFGRALRQNFEGAVYGSKGESQSRVVDALSAGITRESVKEREAQEAKQKERDLQRELDSGAVFRPEGYGGSWREA